ncbi:MAG: hypothetical protein V4706_14705 [Pseudomonadota bacterium]
MQTLVFKLAAAGSVNIMDTIVGYVRYYERTAGGGIDPRIKISSLGGGASAELAPGEAYRLAVPVRGLVVTNMSGEPIEGKLSVAPDSSSIDVGRLQGVVEVVDGGKARSKANVAFMGVTSIGASPGLNGHLQLFNPLGSGKNLVVGRLSMSVGAGGVSFGFSAAALATAQGSGQSKLSGGAVSVATMYREAVVAAGTALGGITPGAGEALVYTFMEPIVVEPGYGLVCWAGDPNVALSAMFEYFEESQ